MPGSKELFTLVDLRQARAMLDPEAFPNTDIAPTDTRDDLAANFWSTSPDVESPDHWWSVDFREGLRDSNGSSEEMRVRCVR